MALLSRCARAYKHGPNASSDISVLMAAGLVAVDSICLRTRHPRVLDTYSLALYEEATGKLRVVGDECHPLWVYLIDKDKDKLHHINTFRMAEARAKSVIERDSDFQAIHPRDSFELVGILVKKDKIDIAADCLKRMPGINEGKFDHVQGNA